MIFRISRARFIIDELGPFLSVGFQAIVATEVSYCLTDIFSLFPLWKQKPALKTD